MTFQVDPMTFINPAYVEEFLNAENQATANTGKFKGKIRCAAFCEILYNLGYITKGEGQAKNHSTIRMNEFSNSRYKLDIKTSMTKKGKREPYRNNPIGGHRPLKNCFTPEEMDKFNKTIKPSKTALKR
jgi:hypothetical protein